MTLSGVSIDVRNATRNDAEQIAEWQIAMARETEGLQLDPLTVRAGVQHIFEHPEIGEYLVGEFVQENSKSAIGCLLLLREWSDWRCGTVLWIHSVYISPEARRHGVFRSLYQHVRARVEQHPNLKGIRLYVDKTNQRALDTYRSLGMNDHHYATCEWMKS